MKVLIVEDEQNAFEYLQTILTKVEPEAEILDHKDSVRSTLSYLDANASALDLIFLDIQLADGLSFEIFKHIDIDVPIIFTTAYDQYAIDAFKLHSVDYLLKPIHVDDLRAAMAKYNSLYRDKGKADFERIQEMISAYRKSYKNRCLVKRGGHFVYVNVADIQFVNSEDSITFLHTSDGRRHMYNQSVEALMKEIDPDQFFQINRSQIVSVEAVREIHPYLNQRLKLLLKSDTKEEFIVSRQRIQSFKLWINR